MFVGRGRLLARIELGRWGLLFRFRTGSACVGARLHLRGVRIMHIVGLRWRVCRLLYGRQGLRCLSDRPSPIRLGSAPPVPQLRLLPRLRLQELQRGRLAPRTRARRPREPGRRSPGTKAGAFRQTTILGPNRRRATHVLQLKSRARSQVRESQFHWLPRWLGAPAAGFKDGNGWLLRAAVNSAASRL